MKSKCKIAVGLILLSGCSDGDQGKKNESDFRAEVVSKAGAAAFNCGDYEIGGDRSAVDQCVVERFGHLEPFYATYQWQGIDSIIRTGVAFNSQIELHIVSFDSDPSGGSHVGAAISSMLCESPRVVSVEAYSHWLPIECG
jgi:hypothetical protein